VSPATFYNFASYRFAFFCGHVNKHRRDVRKGGQNSCFSNGNIYFQISIVTPSESPAICSRAGGLLTDQRGKKMMTKIELAAREYRGRKARTHHPQGKFDNVKRWFPDFATERCACCDGIRAPSCAWPWCLSKHCRSAGHVAALFKVDVTELRHAARRIELQERGGL
jgi:hypothetical protein